MPEDRWLEFDVSPQAQQVRVLTNAALGEFPASDLQPNYERPGWRYALQYQLIRPDGSVMADSVHHFRAFINRFEDPESGDIETKSFFLLSKNIPSNTRTLQIPIVPNSDRPDRIRIKLSEKASQISEVVCRVVAKTERSNYTDPYIWGKLSKGRRKALCRASVYRAELLTPAEKQSLLRWQWTKCPPVIRSQSEITQRILYRKEHVIGRELSSLDTPLGLEINTDRIATIELPDDPGIATILVEVPEQAAHLPGDSEDDSLASDNLTVLYHRPDSFEPEVISLSLQQDFPSELKVQGGMLEVVSTVRGYLQVDWRKYREGASIPIWKQPIQVRAYRIQSGTSVEYSVAHVRERATPLRVDFREVDQPTTAMINWQFIDSNRKVIRQGDFSLQQQISNYDKAMVRGGDYQVTNPLRKYWSVPADVGAVRFYSTSENVFVSAFTRPPDLVREFRLGEEDSINRTWFVINPDDHESLVISNKVAMLDIRKRPPEPRSEFLAGNYRWISYQPDGLWTARRLLTLEDLSNPFSVQTKATKYWTVEPNSQYALSAVNLDRLTLIYDKLTPGDPIAVTLGEVEILSHTCRSHRGVLEVEVPANSQGQMIRCKFPKSGRLFVAQLAGIDKTAWHRMRLAYRLQDGTLTFNYAKATDEEEVLSLRIFRPDAEHRAAEFKVDIAADKQLNRQAYDHWTLLQRRYVLPADDATGESIALDGFCRATKRRTGGVFAAWIQTCHKVCIEFASSALTGKRPTLLRIEHCRVNSKRAMCQSESQNCGLPQNGNKP